MRSPVSPLAALRLRRTVAAAAVAALPSLVAAQEGATPRNAAAGEVDRSESVAREAAVADGRRSSNLIGGLDKTGKIITLALIGGALTVLGTADTDTVEDIGDILQFALPAVAYGTTHLHRDGRGRRDFVKSAGTSALTVILLKESLDKARPNAQGLNSFPSGHTASAFAGASFLNLRYGSRWGAPALVLAGYTGASRIHADKHFLDDVLSGMSISLLANRYFVFPIAEDLRVVPLAGDAGAGLALRWKGSLERWRARSSDVPDPPPQRGFRYQWEFGGTGVDVNDFATSGSGGTISYLFDEANNPTVTARVEFGYTLPKTERQELVVQVAPFEVRDFGTFARDTPFAGTLVPGGVSLRTQYLLYDYRLRYRYLVWWTARVHLHVGAGVSFQDIVATLTWPGGEADIEEGNWAPFAHVDGEVRLGGFKKLRLFAELDAGRSGEDRSIDAALALRYQFHPRWDLGVGTRRIDRTVVTDRLRNHLERDQVVIAIGYSF
jgi:membrane-associated phospholipid phosphatase